MTPKGKEQQINHKTHPLVHRVRLKIENSDFLEEGKQFDLILFIWRILNPHMHKAYDAIQQTISLYDSKGKGTANKSQNPPFGSSREIESSKCFISFKERVKSIFKRIQSIAY